jgi:hypothetical protein
MSGGEGRPPGSVASLARMDRPAGPGFPFPGPLSHDFGERPPEPPRLEDVDVMTALAEIIPFVRCCQARYHAGGPGPVVFTISRDGRVVNSRALHRPADDDLVRVRAAAPRALTACAPASGSAL